MPFVPIEAAGVVDQYANPAELFRHSREQSLHLHLVGQISPEKNRPAAQGLNVRQGLFGLVLAAVEMNGNIEALPREGQNDLPTEAVGATGYNGNSRDFG
jgi:hypothetical protein